jgi:rSAM/selenodomain-associated transferase 1
MKNCLIIFVRNPELGKVKSRLAKGVGKQNALDIYIQLLEHTRDVVAQIECERWVGYSVAVRPNDLWDNSHFTKFKQEGNDLGLRMENAFVKAFGAGHRKVLIVGSDLYDLKPKHIQEALDALDSNELVIGPAQDGGYYLLGMKKLHPLVFRNKNWGTESVFKDTMNDLKSAKIHILEALNDIDYASDLKPYPKFAKYIN